MSPYPAQVTPEKIIESARQLIELNGVAGLTLAELAKELGIKAPSLYKHVSSKGELLKAVNTITNRDLVTAMREVDGDSPAEKLMAMSLAYRAFAHQYPATYQLAFSSLPAESQPDPAELEAMVIPLQLAWAEWVGEENSLTAIRGALALLHGFVSLELSNKYQRGGNLDETFIQVVKTYIAGWKPI